MKFKKHHHNHTKSSNVKHMSSSQASRALLEASTETFNTNSTTSITESSDNQAATYYDYLNKTDDIEQESNGNYFRFSYCFN